VDRRKGIAGRIAALALAALCACDRAKAPAHMPVPTREIVAVVTVEGLGRSALAGAPADAAPFLRSLGGGDGSVVSTPCPATVPAIVSLMTGATPAEHGVLDAAMRRIRDDQPVLAARMRELGFRTAAFVANPLLGRTVGLERGFDIFDGTQAGFFGPERHHPQVRPAAAVIDDATQWLAALPPGARAFVWVHLSDLGEPRIEGAGAPPAARARLDAVDAALRRLRDALAAPPVRGRLIVAGDRGAVPSEEGDLGQGFFVDPAAISVYFAERALGSDQIADPARPRSLTEISARILRAAGAGAPPADEDVVPAGTRVVSASAIPWLWCRWPAAVAVEHAGALYVHDGTWTRTGEFAPGPVGEADVPAEVRAAAQAVAQALELPPASGAHRQGLEAALRSAGVPLAAHASRLGMPARAERRTAIARLQRARLQAAFGDRAGAIDTLGPLARGQAPLLAAQLDTIMLDALRGGRAEAGWQAARAVLARHGPVPQALHWMAHIALQRQERTLAEAELQAYLDEVPKDPDALYDLACARSLAGDPAGAATWLRAAVASGFNQWRALDLDPDLRTLRADPGYAELRKGLGH